MPENHLDAADERQRIFLDYSLVGASPQAELELKAACDRYVADLIKRVEADEGNDRAKAVNLPEITASTVIRADARLRERTPREKPTRLHMLAQFLSPVSGGVAGVYGGVITSPNGTVGDGVAFGFAFAFSAIATGIAVWGKR